MTPRAYRRMRKISRDPDGAREIEPRPSIKKPAGGLTAFRRPNGHVFTFGAAVPTAARASVGVAVELPPQRS